MLNFILLSILSSGCYLYSVRKMQILGLALSCIIIFYLCFIDSLNTFSIFAYINNFEIDINFLQLNSYFNITKYNFSLSIMALIIYLLAEIIIFYKFNEYSKSSLFLITFSKMLVIICFLTKNLFIFYICFEMLLVLMYFLIKNNINIKNDTLNFEQKNQLSNNLTSNVNIHSTFANDKLKDLAAKVFFIFSYAASVLMIIFLINIHILSVASHEVDISYIKDQTQDINPSQDQDSAALQDQGSAGLQNTINATFISDLNTENNHGINSYSNRVNLGSNINQAEIVEVKKDISYAMNSKVTLVNHYNKNQEPNRGAYFKFQYFNIENIANTLKMQDKTLYLIILLIFFSSKIPLFPLHTWLPLAHTQAKTAISIVLSSVLLKIGAVGMINFFALLYDSKAEGLIFILINLCGFGIIYFNIISCYINNAKKIIAYSSVSSMGYVMLALCLNINNLEKTSIISILSFYMIAHGFIAAGLFFLVGKVQSISKTLNINNIKNIKQNFPKLGIFFLLFTLVSIGAPFTALFIGKFTLIYIILDASIFYAGVAIFGIFLSIFYQMRLYNKVILSQDLSSNMSFKNKEDLNYIEIIILLILLIFIILLGISPKIIF